MKVCENENTLFFRVVKKTTLFFSFAFAFFTPITNKQTHEIVTKKKKGNKRRLTEGYDDDNGNDDNNGGDGNAVVEPAEAVRGPVSAGGD